MQVILCIATSDTPKEQENKCDGDNNYHVAINIEAHTLTLERKTPPEWGFLLSRRYGITARDE